MTRVLAVDPGPHVGLAYWSNDDPANEVGGGETWREWEETPVGFYTAVSPWVAGVNVIVCENFFISGARAASANETIEMIGVLRYLCGPRGPKGLIGTQFVLQAPGDAKAFASNAKLKRLGWYKPATADHARSATRHLVLYLVSNGLLSPDRLLDSPAEEGGTS